MLPDRADLRRARRDRRRGGRAPAGRRGLPGPRVRRVGPAAGRRRRARARRSRSASCRSRTRWPGLRIGWLATRDRDLLARVRGVQGLHDDLLVRAVGDPRDHRAARRRPGPRAVARRSSPRTSSCSTRFFDDWADRFTLGPAARRLDRVPAVDRPGRQDRRLGRRASSQAEGVLLLPGSRFGDAGQPFPARLRPDDLPVALDRLEASRAQDTPVTIGDQGRRAHPLCQTDIACLTELDRVPLSARRQRRQPAMASLSGRHHPSSSESASEVDEPDRDAPAGASGPGPPTPPCQPTRSAGPAAAGDPAGDRRRQSRGSCPVCAVPARPDR